MAPDISGSKLSSIIMNSPKIENELIPLTLADSQYIGPVISCNSQANPVSIDARRAQF